jgi:biotin transport system substrate-specific component
MAMNARTATVADAFRPRVDKLVWDVSLIVVFGTAMVLFAQISIPLWFTPVPITGQTFGVLLTGAVLGSRRGSAAMMVYLAEGIAGLPVFALGHAGWPVITGPTGGYLLSYPIAAFVVGFLAERGWDRNIITAGIAMVFGEIAIYAVGLPWLAHFVPSGQAIPLGLTPFIGGDTAKLVLAAAILPSAWRAIDMLHPRLPTNQGGAG